MQSEKQIDGVQVNLENFDNLSTLYNVIMSRPNNSIMEDEHSSTEVRSNGWAGTKTWEEAVDLLHHGYKEVVPDIKKNATKSMRKYDNTLVDVHKKVIKNRPVGYIPNVPAALMGLPNSMITTESIPYKRKAFHVIYFITANCGKDAQEFIDGGIALVTAIQIIERTGVQIRLDLGFMSSQRGNQVIFGTTTIKNYGERFDLQKIAFPMIHPAMFRRIGFKYLETVPTMVEDYTGGYGHTIEDVDDLTKYFEPPKDTYVMDIDWINEHDNSVDDILKYFEVNKRG